MNNLFESEGYSPGEELSLIFNKASSFSSKLDYTFYGIHTARILCAYKYYDELADISCLKPTPMIENSNERIQHIMEVKSKIEKLNSELAYSTLELISAISKSTGLSEVSFISSLEEVMISKNLQLSFFPTSPIDSVLSLARYRLIYEFGLGNYKFQSMNLQLKFPSEGIPQMGSVVSPIMSETFEKVIVSYLLKLSRAVIANATLPNSPEKELHLRNEASNILVWYFTVLEFIGVNQFELLTQIIKQTKDESKKD